MKKLLTRALVGAMLVGGSVSAIDYTFAQKADKPNKGQRSERFEKFRNMTPEQRADKRIEQMKKNLALTDAQAAQIRAILIEDGNRMKQAHEARNAAKTADQKLTKEQRQANRQAMKAQHQAMKAQHQATKDRIAAVLNAEQKAKLEAQKSHRKEKMMKHMKGRRGDGVQRNSLDMQKDLKQQAK